jgi:hypothetical protein
MLLSKILFSTTINFKYVSNIKICKRSMSSITRYTNSSNSNPSIPRLSSPSIPTSSQNVISNPSIPTSSENVISNSLSSENRIIQTRQSFQIPDNRVDDFERWLNLIPDGARPDDPVIPSPVVETAVSPSSISRYPITEERVHMYQKFKEAGYGTIEDTDAVLEDLHLFSGHIKAIVEVSSRDFTPYTITSPHYTISTVMEPITNNTMFAMIDYTYTQRMDAYQFNQYYVESMGYDTPLYRDAALYVAEYVVKLDALNELVVKMQALEKYFFTYHGVAPHDSTDLCSAVSDFMHAINSFI